MRFSPINRDFKPEGIKEGFWDYIGIISLHIPLGTAKNKHINLIS
jgi:hypothetical protein